MGKKSKKDLEKSSNVLSKFMSVRLKPWEIELFEEKCAEIGESRSDQHRLIIRAFNEGRLKIKPSAEDRKRASMYK